MLPLFCSCFGIPCAETQQYSLSPPSLLELSLPRELPCSGIVPGSQISEADCFPAPSFPNNFFPPFLLPSVKLWPIIPMTLCFPLPLFRGFLLARAGADGSPLPPAFVGSSSGPAEPQKAGAAPHRSPRVGEGVPRVSSNLLCWTQGQEERLGWSSGLG